MVVQQLVASNYTKDRTETAATTHVSHESVRRDKRESGMAALVDTIDNDGLFDYEQTRTLHADRTVNVHTDLRDRDHPPFDDPASVADWLPTGQDEEDRILSLLSSEPF